ncbi:hypothetical protein D3C80_2230290 [compost metagenome]
MGARDTGVGFHEHYRFRRNRQIGLLCMIPVIQPDREELAGYPQWRPQPWIPLHGRESRWIDIL